MEEKLIQFIREYLPLWMQNGIRDAFKMVKKKALLKDDLY
jgi:hypothetical protein